MGGENMTELESWNHSGPDRIGTTEEEALSSRDVRDGGIMTVFEPLPEEKTVLKACGTASSGEPPDKTVLIADFEEKVREAWAAAGSASKQEPETGLPYETVRAVPDAAVSVSETTSNPAPTVSVEASDTPQTEYVSGGAMYGASVTQDGNDGLLAALSGAWVPGSGLNYSASNDTSAYKKLPFTMPQAEYSGGCTATSVGMLFAYYDLYGYCGFDASDLIAGTVEIFSRDSNIYDMSNESVLGQYIASGLYTANTGYYARFFGTTPAQELPYTYVTDAQGKVVLGGDGELQLNTDEWDCLADWMGTGQYYRGNDDYSSSYM